MTPTHQRYRQTSIQNSVFELSAWRGEQTHRKNPNKTRQQNQTHTQPTNDSSCKELPIVYTVTISKQVKNKRGIDKRQVCVTIIAMQKAIGIKLY